MSRGGSNLSLEIWESIVEHVPISADNCGASYWFGVPSALSLVYICMTRPLFRLSFFSHFPVARPQFLSSCGTIHSVVYVLLSGAHTLCFHGPHRDYHHQGRRTISIVGAVHRSRLQVVFGGIWYPFVELWSPGRHAICPSPCEGEPVPPAIASCSRGLGHDSPYTFLLIFVIHRRPLYLKP